MEALPCPFCRRETSVLHIEDKDKWFSICLDCRSRTRLYAARNEAVKAWNRRADGTQ